MWVVSQDKTEVIDTKRIQVDGAKIYVFVDELIADEVSWIMVGEFSSKVKAKQEIKRFLESLNNDKKYYEISVEDK